jgi:NTP pyrophosphatase (non-canonical NTP hydrolase)
MNKLDTDKLLTEINQFTKERDWEKFHSTKNLAMALSVETSELVEIFQWMTEAESDSLNENKEKKVHLEEEMADIFYYLLKIASKHDINLEAAVLKKLEKNKLKYPIEKSKGIAEKYNRL